MVVFLSNPKKWFLRMKKVEKIETFMKERVFDYPPRLEDQIDQWKKLTQLPTKKEYLTRKKVYV